ncbi:MAG: acyl carrier protein [Nannocystaceae bacterium]|nr:acyl carrier protein [Myxococcales bacterium]
MDESAIKLTIREFIVQEIVPGGNPDEITDSLSLVKSGLLRSMEALRMFAFLEETYDIEISPEDVRIENLGSIDAIARFVLSKRD